MARSRCRGEALGDVGGLFGDLLGEIVEAPVLAASPKRASDGD
jgi:hypothetical protein